MNRIVEEYCQLEFGRRPNLEDWVTRVPSEELDFASDKEAGLVELDTIGQQLAELQRKLWAEKRHKVLVVLQGMDTSGKDGTIRRVFRYTHPNGVNVAPFDKPTRRELSYDYLWRVHKRVPHAGEMVIFDRSHYEDIVTVRVNGLKPEAVWSRRYRHLIEFERMLVDEGVTIIKFFLHISRDEQRERLNARLNHPEKHWKFDSSDLEAREKWNDYKLAYEDVIEQCNKPFAPWFIIPSDRKWQRNLLVAYIVCSRLNALGLAFPKPDFDMKGIVIE